MSRVDVPALVALILFATFIAYEIAGGSPRFPDWHTLSFYGYRILWVKVLLTAGPPALYLVWITWHLDQFVPK